VTLANLATVGDLLVRHLPGIEQILEIYPAMAAAGPSVIEQTSNGAVGKLGLVLQATPTPQDCGDKSAGRQGYGGTQVRSPTGPGYDAPAAPNVAAQCTGPSSGTDYTNVRGSANVPGGDPVSISGGGVAYPRTVTGNTVATAPVPIGPSLPTSATLGDGSWLGLVTASLH
jgi:phospholipid/cholesterol/gamma-HCH transport system substrate-binding protein